MRFLIAGGGGFIGSHLSEKLLKKGHKVVAVDNFCSSSRKNIEGFKEHENFNVVEEDILNGVSIEGEIDYVLHFASRASPKNYQEHPLHTLRTNTEGTLKMCRLADNKNAKLLYASTSEVYGDPEKHPQTEDYWGNVNPHGPRSCYDEGKRAGEATLRSYSEKNNLDYRIIRIFNTYGPRMMKNDGRVVTNFMRQAKNGKPITVYGDGTQTRSFCYIEDLVAGIIKSTESENGKVYNLGNPEEHTINELAEKIKDLTGSDSQIVHRELPQDDPLRRKPDISKAKRELGWEPETGLSEGLEKTLKAF